MLIGVRLKTVPMGAFLKWIHGEFILEIIAVLLLWKTIFFKQSHFMGKNGSSANLLLWLQDLFNMTRVVILHK